MGNIFGLSDAEMAGWECPKCGYLNGFFSDSCSAAKRGWKTILRLLPSGELWHFIYNRVGCPGKPIRSSAEAEKVGVYTKAIVDTINYAPKGASPCDVEDCNQPPSPLSGICDHHEQGGT